MTGQERLLRKLGGKTERQRRKYEEAKKRVQFNEAFWHKAIREWRSIVIFCQFEAARLRDMEAWKFFEEWFRALNEHLHAAEAYTVLNDIDATKAPMPNNLNERRMSKSDPKLIDEQLTGGKGEWEQL